MNTPSRRDEIKKSLAVIGAALAMLLLGMAVGRMVAASVNNPAELMITSVSGAWIAWSVWYWIGRVR